VVFGSVEVRLRYPVSMSLLYIFISAEPATSRRNKDSSLGKRKTRYK